MLTVLLVDDHSQLHQALQAWLAEEPNIAIMGVARDTEEVIERVRDHAPAVVIVDVNITQLNGVNATESILAASPESKIIALSTHVGKPAVDDLLRAGATAYILKADAPGELVQRIRAIMRGDSYLSTAVTDTLASTYASRLPALETRAGQPRECLLVTASEAGAEPILRTRLHRPPVASDLVVRTALLERLNHGRERALTLVSAPAGYGKSTLVSSWLEIYPWPSGWLSLDEGDNRLDEFLRYLVAAVRCTLPATLSRTLLLANAPTLAPVSVLATNLANELDQLERPIVLVLDDYHRIRNTAVHDLVAKLLRYPPRSLRLVLTTRQDPPLPIAELRARGQLTEIRQGDLRFSPLETARFLAKASPNQVVDEAVAEAWTEKTEGWAVGLRLLALATRHHGDGFLHLPAIKDSDCYVSDYLIAEVLTNQPAPMRWFLPRLSLVGRFCAPLCDAMVQSANAPAGQAVDGEALIGWLRANNLFVVPLDTEGRWFRYHNLFQALLQDQLKRECSLEEIAALHTRASQWFEAQGLIEEAIRHALLAGDDSGAVRLVECHRYAALNEDKWYVLEGWLSLLPASIKRQRPGLLLAQAWINHFHFRMVAIPPIIDVAESLLLNAAKEQALQGEIDFFKGVACFLRNDGSRSLKYLGSALQRIPLAYDIMRGRAEVFLGLARQLQGQHELAVRELNDLLCVHQGQHGLTARLLATLVFIHIMSGDLAKAFMVNQQLRELFSKYHDPYARAWMSYLQGLIHLFRNELDPAIHHFSEAVEWRYILQTRAAVDCLAGLSFAYQAAQQTDKARATLELLFEYVSASDDPALIDIAHSCKARLSLIQGELVCERDRLRRGAKPKSEAMLFWAEVPAITHCRILLAEGSQASLREAENQLRAYLQWSQDQHNTRQMIDILLLLAVSYQKQNRFDEAASTLRRAVDLAAAGSWIRSFVELGSSVADVVVELHRRGSTPFIRRLLEVFGADPLRSVGASRCVLMPVVDRQPPVWEALTNRELDILELLAQRLQNKEIAVRLGISTETVKAHLRNLYQKLNVSTRRQAVAKTIGIDPSDWRRHRPI
ncbi:MAG: response regulator [Gammaproteobacteria bacterium]